MKESTSLILSLLEELDTVEGRTMMQKIVFILKSKFRQFHDFSFSLHYYGPFSRELAEELDRLRLKGLIQEVPVRYGDFVRYDIRLTKQGEEQLKPTRVKEKKFQEITRVARALNARPLSQVIDEAYSIAMAKGLD